MSRPTALIAAAAALALAATAAAALAASSSTLPRVLDCAGAPLLRPQGTLVLSCADANSEIKSTHWSAWSASGAAGTTDFGLNLCTPSCVASRIRFFPNSSVRLSRPVTTSKGRLFSRAVISYTLNGKRRSFTAELVTN